MPPQEQGDGREREAQTQMREEAWRDQQRRGAADLASKIATREITYPYGVEAAVMDIVASAQVRGEQLTEWEVGPLMNELLARAQSGLVIGAEKEIIETIDIEIAKLELNPLVQQAYAEIDAKGQSAMLTIPQIKAYEGVQKLVDHRRAVLKLYAGGTAALFEERATCDVDMRDVNRRGDALWTALGRKPVAQAEYDERDQIWDTAEREYFNDIKDPRTRSQRLKEYGRLADDRSKGRLGPKATRRLNEIEDEIRRWMTNVDHYDELCSRIDIQTNVDQLMAQKALLNQTKAHLDEQIEAKLDDGVTRQWWDLYKAFKGAVALNNTMYWWERNGSDLEAAAVQGFTNPRWTETFLPPDMAALFGYGKVANGDLPQERIGVAMETAFRALAAVVTGAGRLGKDGNYYEAKHAALLATSVGDVTPENILLQDKVTQADRERFATAIEQFVMKNCGCNAFWASFAVRTVQQLYETTLLSGYYGIKRDVKTGDIVYKDEGGNQSASYDSKAYAWGEPAADGCSSFFGRYLVDWEKMRARARVLGQAEAGYKTGMPALVEFLPDDIILPEISHEEMLAIFNGSMDVEKLYKKKSNDSRWGWHLGVFRGAQAFLKYMSEFVVGAKGVRPGDAVSEVEFFLKNFDNLQGMKKVLEGGLARTKGGLAEVDRFIMNMIMALLYAVRNDLIQVANVDEVWSVLVTTQQGKSAKELVNPEDDLVRACIRSGLLTRKQINYVVERLGYYKLMDTRTVGEQEIAMGESMIRRSEVNKLIKDGILREPSKDADSNKEIRAKRRKKFTRKS